MVSKPTTQQYHELSVFSLRKNGCLRDGFSGRWRWSNPVTRKETASINIQCKNDALHLHYKTNHSGEEWRDRTVTLFLSKTNPNYGGERLWFVCPGCNTRRAKLYGGQWFRCRACQGAYYQTQLESPTDRAFARFYKRRHRLGAYGGMQEPFPPKPKWMRWATYERLALLDQRDCQSVLRIEMDWLKSLRERK